MSPVLMAFAAAAVPVVAPPTADPAATRIEAFYPVLADSMRRAKTLGFEGRVAKLRPAVDALFAFPVMAQFAVGARWATLSPADRKAVGEAMSRYTIRSYAHNFDRDAGAALIVDPRVATHGADKLVKTTIPIKGDAPVTLSYRMREYEGAWRVIDVYYNSISQLTAQRAEFSHTLSLGGVPALVAELDKKMIAPR